MMHDALNLETLVIVLAGGEGSRLWPLTELRTKPAVPIGAKYRLIDIPLSNAFNSGLHNLDVLTQGKDASLGEHIKNTWPSDPRHNSSVRVISPQSLEINYEGDADAVRHVRHNIQDFCPKYVLVVPGDHLLKMDYSKFIKAMKDSGADGAISLIPRDLEYASQLGSININSSARITELREKDPQTPLRVPGSETQFYASMGIYAFTTHAILDAMNLEGNLFGRHILPQIIDRMNIIGYDYQANNHIPDRVRLEQDGYMQMQDVERSKDSDYWRDVGTIGEFFEANMDLVSIDPAFNLYNNKWKFFTYRPEEGPAKIVQATNSIVSSGTVMTDIQGGDNVISTSCYIDKSTLNKVIVFDHANIQRSSIQNTIVDKNTVVWGMDIGYDAERDINLGIWVDEDSGIRVVPKKYNSTNQKSVDHWRRVFDMKRDEIARKNKK